MAGGATGEAINQVTGVTPFDPLAIGMSALPGGASTARRVFPGMTRTVTPRAARAIGSRLPGAGGAVMESARETAEAGIERIRTLGQAVLADLGPDVDTDALFAMARGSGARIPLRETRRQLGPLLQTLETTGELGLPDQFGSVLRALNNITSQTPNVAQGLDINTFDSFRRSLGSVYGQLPDGPRRDTLRRVLRGFYQDLENAIEAGSAGAAALRTALNVSRLEFAADDFARLIERSIGRTQIGSDFQPFRINQMVDELDKVMRGRPSRDMRLFADAFQTPIQRAEIEDIIETLREWNQVASAVPPPRGTNFGSGMNIAAGSLGFGGGTLATGDPVTGAAIGALTPGLRILLTRGLMTQRGRAALRQFISQGVPVNIPEFAQLLLSQTARQAVNPRAISERLLRGMHGGQQPRFENP